MKLHCPECHSTEIAIYLPVCMLQQGNGIIDVDDGAETEYYAKHVRQSQSHAYVECTQCAFTGEVNDLKVTEAS